MASAPSIRWWRRPETARWCYGPRAEWSRTPTRAGRRLGSENPSLLVAQPTRLLRREIERVVDAAHRRRRVERRRAVAARGAGEVVAELAQIAQCALDGQATRPRAVALVVGRPDAVLDAQVGAVPVVGVDRR